MTWDEFVSNVRQWSTERGIYEHSTAVAQALKACSEAGELCDAVIKGDREAMIDSCGDVVVCIINVATMENQPIDLTYVYEEASSIQQGAALVSIWCSMLANRIAMSKEPSEETENALHSVQDFCVNNGLDFLECCESAWSEIKDRKGRMVAGGAFVKGEA